MGNWPLASNIDQIIVDAGLDTNQRNALARHITRGLSDTTAIPARDELAEFINSALFMALNIEDDRDGRDRVKLILSVLNDYAEGFDEDGERQVCCCALLEKAIENLDVRF